jgi:predicted acetyltransferase
MPGDDTSELAKIHNAYIANINQGIYRDYWPDNRGWKRFIQQDPYSTGIFLYLWKDETGIARSYIKYKHSTQDGMSYMTILELAYIDKKGLYGAFGIISNLSSQYNFVKWSMPSFMDPYDFIGDAWAIEQTLRPRDMTRIINVKAALEMMRHPKYDGEFVIEVLEDNNLPVNNGKYLVEFSPSGLTCQTTSKDADIRCNILVFSQLVTGYRTLENAMYTLRAGLEVNCNKVTSNIETLKQVFTLRPQHVTENF